MTSLIITNGDSASDLLIAAGKSGRIIPWRDSLHEGPLGALSSNENREVFQNLRAEYWASRGVGERTQLKQTYQERDELLATHNEFERIELWFEHDLYDQLQLIEILTRLYHLKRFDNVFLVQAETYLGMQSPDSILDLEKLITPVGEQMMAIADLAWQTVSHDTPSKMKELIGLKPAGFLFLTQALLRFLEELPGLDGLSRTERQIVYSLNRGVNRPGMLFARSQAMESAQFWGDLGFFDILSKLQYCTRPLLEGLPETFSIDMFQESERRKAFLQADLKLTGFGAEILSGEEDNANYNSINRYVGGTHLRPSNLWRWDQNKTALISPPTRS